MCMFFVHIEIACIANAIVVSKFIIYLLAKKNVKH